MLISFNVTREFRWEKRRILENFGQTNGGKDENQEKGEEDADAKNDDLQAGDFDGVAADAAKETFRE
jgi:hypothetical protein